MTACVWIGGSSNNWADRNNGTPTGHSRACADTARIDAAGTYSISIAAGETDALPP